MSLQVKICGFTQATQAARCAELGAAALGVIFYPPSPRHVEVVTAAEIVAAAAGVPVVGVFVNATVDAMLHTCQAANIHWAQLHGAESPGVVAALQERGVRVLKVLRSLGDELAADLQRYAHADGIMVEAGSGPLPGGNGSGWLWGAAQLVSAQRPLALAGGLNAENILTAGASAQASLLDLSSGVEIAPGHKDLEKVAEVLRLVQNFDPHWKHGVMIA